MFALSKTSRVTLGVLGGAVLLFAFMSPGNVFGAEEAAGGSDPVSYTHLRAHET